LAGWLTGLAASPAFLAAGLTLLILLLLVVLLLQVLVSIALILAAI